MNFDGLLTVLGHKTPLSFDVDHNMVLMKTVINLIVSNDIMYWSLLLQILVTIHS